MRSYLVSSDLVSELAARTEQLIAKTTVSPGAIIAVDLAADERACAPQGPIFAFNRSAVDALGERSLSRTRLPNFSVPLVEWTGPHDDAYVLQSRAELVRLVKKEIAHPSDVDWELVHSAAGNLAYVTLGVVLTNAELIRAEDGTLSADALRDLPIEHDEVSVLSKTLKIPRPGPVPSQHNVRRDIDNGMEPLLASSTGQQRGSHGHRTRPQLGLQVAV